MDASSSRMEIICRLSDGKRMGRRDVAWQPLSNPGEIGLRQEGREVLSFADHLGAVAQLPTNPQQRTRSRRENQTSLPILAIGE
jgi:hypothetical protein